MSVLPYEKQWEALMKSSMFTETAMLSVNGEEPFEIVGIYISGTFSEDSPAAYAPKSYEERDFFRLSGLQLEGKVSRPWRETLVGARLVVRDISFRVFRTIGKNSGDLELELQEVTDNDEA